VVAACRSTDWADFRLYKEQWTRLLEMADDIRTFIKENDGKLKAKPE
jgi:hypothetical protein